MCSEGFEESEEFEGFKEFELGGTGTGGFFAAGIFSAATRLS
jgi:hypothetical protein